MGSITNDYNQVMNLISSNGSNGQDIDNAIDQLQGDLGSQDPDVQSALTNVKNSLSDGTYSQQGSQGALEGAANKDGMQGVQDPEINGDANMGSQDAGLYDSSKAQGGAVGSNSYILMDEMKGGAPTSQILNNATALQKEATNAGDTNTANAAANIIQSFGDGSYNAQNSATAINNALNQDVAAQS